MPVLARALARIVAVGAGAAAGLVGSFVHGSVAYGVALGLVTALALSLLTFVVAGVAARSRTGAVLAVTGWLLPVLLLAVRRPEGDLVVPGTASGYAWLIGGTILGGCTIAWPYASRLVSGGSAPSGEARIGR